MEFYKRLRDLREDKDKTQKDIADILEIRYNVYQRYEYGERLIPIDKVISLAKYYDVSTDYLLGLTNNPTHFRKDK